MPTLAEIAARAGVSESTVSRVLNHRAGVSNVARESVMTAIGALGYEPPARLRRRSAGLVGLVVPELDNPIFPAFAQAVEGALNQRRYTPVLCSQSRGGPSEQEYVESLLDHGVSGIVFVSGRHADTDGDLEPYRSLIQRNVPVAFVNGFQEGVSAPFFSVDDDRAIELAVSHLAALGHRRIGLAIGPRRYVPSQRKQSAFPAATLRHGVRAEDEPALVREGLFTVEGGAAAARRLLEDGATAIICGSDLMALGAMRAVRRAGKRVPQDVSVVGFDDSPFMQFVDPPLTTVRQPVADIAAAAVEAIDEAIKGRAVAPNEYLFEPELVLRGSTGRPAR